MKINQTPEFKLAQSARMKLHWIKRHAKNKLKTPKNTEQTKKEKAAAYQKAWYQRNKAKQTTNLSNNTQEKFKIESSIKLPTINKLYPFHRMQKGDSFSFPKTLRKSVGINASHYQKATKTTFIVHERNKGECRIWRTK